MTTMTNNGGSGLILALSKGRIFEDTLPLLESAGITVLENPETSRKLILPTNDPDVRVLIVRASDVPTYVQHGAAVRDAVELVRVLQHGSVTAMLHVRQDLRDAGLDGVVGFGLEGQQGVERLLEVGCGGVELADLYCHDT